MGTYDLDAPEHRICSDAMARLKAERNDAWRGLAERDAEIARLKREWMSVEVHQGDGVTHTSRQTGAPQESGTLRGDYERMAREWCGGLMCGNHDANIDSLAALLARVADERQGEIVEALRDKPVLLDSRALANWIGSNAWRGEAK